MNFGNTTQQVANSFISAVKGVGNFLIAPYNKAAGIMADTAMAPQIAQNKQDTVVADAQTMKILQQRASALPNNSPQKADLMARIQKLSQGMGQTAGDTSYIPSNKQGLGAVGTMGSAVLGGMSPGFGGATRALGWSGPIAGTAAGSAAAMQEGSTKQILGAGALGYGVGAAMDFALQAINKRLAQKGHPVETKQDPRRYPTEQGLSPEDRLVESEFRSGARGPIEKLSAKEMFDDFFAKNPDASPDEAIKWMNSQQEGNMMRGVKLPKSMIDTKILSDVVGGDEDAVRIVGNAQRGFYDTSVADIQRSGELTKREATSLLNKAMKEYDQSIDPFWDPKRWGGGNSMKGLTEAQQKALDAIKSAGKATGYSWENKSTMKWMGGDVSAKAGDVKISESTLSALERLGHIKRTDVPLGSMSRGGVEWTLTEPVGNEARGKAGALMTQEKVSAALQNLAEKHKGNYNVIIGDLNSDAGREAVTQQIFGKAQGDVGGVWGTKQGAFHNGGFLGYEFGLDGKPGTIAIDKETGLGTLFHEIGHTLTDKFKEGVKQILSPGYGPLLTKELGLSNYEIGSSKEIIPGIVRVFYTGTQAQRSMASKILKDAGMLAALPIIKGLDMLKDNGGQR